MSSSTLTKLPESTKPSAGLTPKMIFAKELHYQVYRIEKVLKVTDPSMVKVFAKNHPEYTKRSLLQSFFDSYEKRHVNKFIENAKNKTQAEREHLLEGIRRLIYKAKQEKHTAKVEVKRNKGEKQRDSKMAHLETLLSKKSFSNEEMSQIEKNVATPFDTGKGKLNFNKIRYFYTTILTGQKVFGSRIQNMQGQYKEAIDKLKKYKQQSSSGLKKYVGVACYGYRKVKGIFSWGKKKLGFKVDKTKKDKINSAIEKARDYYANRLNMVKRLKTHIANRSVELKKGLGVFRGDLREKLKVLIARGEWTGSQEKKTEEAKKQLQEKKSQLAQGLIRAQAQRENIELTQQGVGRMQTGLQDKLKRIHLSGPLLQQKIVAVKARIAQLEKQYGPQDPRVKEIKQKVLMGLLMGQDRIEQVKEGTAGQLTVAEKKYQELNILKGDVYLSETNIVNQIEKAELGITYATKKMEALKKNRLELQKMLEGMETAYVAIDDFKENVSKNLDKMGKVNENAVKGIDEQYKYLKQAKATDPGLGTALYNTVGIGRLGIMGGLKTISNIPAGVVWLFNGNNWNSAKKWSITGMLGRVQGGFDKWLKKGGFNHPGLNVVAGVANAVFSAVNGLTTLFVDFDKVLDSLGVMVSDLGLFKKALKGVIHYDDWANGRTSIAFGKTVGDVLVLFFTAGTSAGAQATAKLGSTAGKVARMFTYTKGFMKEVAREAWNIPKNAGRFAVSLPRKAARGIKYAAGAIYHIKIGKMKGLRAFIYNENLVLAKEAVLSDLQNYMGKLSTKKLGRLNVSTRKMLQDVLKNPTEAGMRKLTTRLENEFYAGGWRTRQVVGSIQGKLKKYIKLDIKHMKGKEFLRQKYGSLESAKEVVKSSAESADIFAKYNVARKELKAAREMEIPKKGDEVTKKMIAEVKKEKKLGIKKAQDTYKTARKELKAAREMEIPKKGDGVTKKMIAEVKKEKKLGIKKAQDAYKTARKELKAAREMEIPKKGDEVTKKMIAEVKKEKKLVIKKAQDTHNVALELLNKRYADMRVENGLLKKSISEDEAMFRYQKAKKEFAKVEKMKEGLKKTKLLKQATERLKQEKALLENIKSSVCDLFRATDDLLSTLAQSGVKGVFGRMKVKSRIKDLIRRLELEAESGIKVGNRITKLETALGEIRLYQKARLKIAGKFKTASASVDKIAIFVRGNKFIWPEWLNISSFKLRVKSIGKDVREFFSKKGKAVSSKPSVRINLLPKKSQLIENLTNIEACRDASARITTLLKERKLREAIKLYRVVRISAHKLGVPLAAVDKSFIGYLRKVMPATGMYLGRVEDIMSADVLSKLPSKIKIDKKQFDAMQKANIALIKRI